MGEIKRFRTSMIVAAATAVPLLAVAAARPAEAASPGSNGKISFDRSFRIWVQNPTLGSAETKLRDDGPSDGEAAFSPDGSRVVFIRRVPGPEIFVTNADGTGTPRRLTNNTVVDSDPVWSHDGTRIAFQRGGQIWSMNADGTAQKQLTTELSFAPSWSVPMVGAPDGKIAFARGGRIWTMLPNGSGQVELSYTCPTDNGFCDNAVGDPAFSPDGSEIAAEYFGDIFIIPSAGGEARLLLGTPTDGYPGQELDPVWSPDGTMIAFEHNGNIAGSPLGIYWAKADGSSSMALQLTDKTGEANPDWQPVPRCTKTVNANNDPLTGTAGKDVLCGDNRDNRISGGGGNDIILGKGGHDRLTGGGANDIINGGPGTDTALYSGTRPVVANLMTEFATGVGQDVLLGIEDLTGSSLDDTFIGSSRVPNVLNGMDGNDILNVQDGFNNDAVHGGLGTGDQCTKDAGDATSGCP